ncbi:MAG: hypothetical protein PVG32_17390 [Anaerolineales bacterium]
MCDWSRNSYYGIDDGRKALVLLHQDWAMGGRNTPSPLIAPSQLIPVLIEKQLIHLSLTTVMFQVRFAVNWYCRWSQMTAPSS